MSWYHLDLGDALLAQGELHELSAQCQSAFEQAGAPVGWAVYLAHVSGNLHCRAQLCFSPKAAELARGLGARCCAAPPRDASLLVGDGTGLLDHS